MERSIGHTGTELAVMVDTFRPLMVTEEAMDLTMVSTINLGLNSHASNEAPERSERSVRLITPKDTKLKLSFCPVRYIFMFLKKT
jgi:hypothetical protein